MTKEEPQLLNESLFEACKTGDSARVLSLLERGAELESKGKAGRSPLSRAALNGKTEAALMLITHGADLESKSNYGRSALSWAAISGYTETALALMANGAKASSVLALPEALQFKESILDCLNYPLHQAATQGLIKECVQLLDLGYDVDQKDDKDMTPMQHAEQKNHEETGLILRSWLARKAAHQIMREMGGMKP